MREKSKDKFSPKNSYERRHQGRSRSRSAESRSKSNEAKVVVGKNQRCVYVENGTTKAVIDIVVPKHLVDSIIGRDERNIKAIVNKSGCIIRFVHGVR